MKNHLAPRPAALCLLFASLSGISHGDTLQYWNPSGTGGDGIWGTGPGEKNWNLAPGALAGNTAWKDAIDDVAVFQDATGGTVTVFDTVLTTGITQTGANYTIEAGTIGLAADSASNAPLVNVQSGTLTIKSLLVGSAGLVKGGGGTLHLSAGNPYAGTTAVQGGTLNLTGSLASSDLSISSGATLLNQAGGLSNSATLTNAGSLTLNASNTIASYISGGGTLTAGAGTLSTTSATLNNGSTVAGLLNTGSLTSNGAALLSGTATAGSTLISSGTLTLSGAIISNAVNISSGASLLNQNGGLSNTATLTNAGSLTLNASDTIASYISDGGTLTAGAGTLFTNSTTLNNRSTVAGRLYTDDFTSNGTVTMSGIVTAKGTTSVQSGTLDLTGTLTTTNLTIASGATLIQNGRIGPSSVGSAVTVVTNEGSLLVDESAIFKSYISNGGLLDIRGGRMITQTVMLNDGSTTKGGPFSANLITTNGAVRIENAGLSARTTIASGVLDLAGSLSATQLEILAGAALLNQNGGLTAKADLTNAGSLTLNASDTITSYISNGGILTAGAGTLFTNSSALNNGSTVAGLLDTSTLTSNGAVLFSGTATAGRALIASGTLTLSGALASNAVNISSGASLLNQSGGLSNSATLTNAGSLTFDVNDTIASYISDGGILTAGAGTLFTTNATLNNGSTVAGLLDTSTLTSNGAVLLSGTATAGSALISSGTLTLSGALASNAVNISSGASLLNQSGGLSSSAEIINLGLLTLSVDETIASYVSKGGTLTTGAGTLFASSAELTNGSFVAGQLNSETLISRGAVSVTGTIITDGATIQGGVLTLAGSLISDSVRIRARSELINVNGGLSNSATLTNAGSLTLDVNDTIASYISNGGILTNGAGTLFTTSTMLNDGSTLAGLLNTGTLTSNGAVLLSGTATAGSALISSGTLTLSGTLASDAVNISSGASLLNQSGGLSNSATLTNAGSLTFDVNDTIASYISDGGILTAGAGTLFTTTAALNNGSTVAGLLDTNTLTSDGSVLVTGTVAANSIHIASGMLTNTGTFGNPTTLLNINQGAILLAGGLQQYALLTTSGAGPGTWQGDLINTSTLAPGGVGAVGILAVEGNFAQSPSGLLKFDLSASGSDLLDVSGSTTFGGSLELNQSGAAIAPFVPVTVVSAAAFSGNISSLSENLDGAVWFNPGNGTVTRLELPSGNGGSFFGATRNQTSTWISLYDDVIDPCISNITTDASGYNISSGIADAGNPDLLWALSASFTPVGLNAALLNRLSPEVYGGFSDYAMQSTRAHQRSALSAPPLAPKENPNSGGGAKGGAKNGVAGAPAPLDWEFFATVDHFRAGTENSRNQADYDFEGMGVLAGARTRLSGQTQLAFYLGADSGTIDGHLIDADALGWNSGVSGEHFLDAKSQTRLTAAASYGSYLFDGTRGSASATSAGWMPGQVDFDDVDVKAFDFVVGVDGVAWKKDALTFIPSAGLRYAMSTMDAFDESTGGAPGSPIALDVSRDRHESLLLELGLLAQVEVNEDLALWAEGGVNIGLLDDDRLLAARFAKGERTMRAEAAGLDADSLYLGIGAVYQITESISAALAYRADIRSGAEAQQELRLSTSWRF